MFGKRCLQTEPCRRFFSLSHIPTPGAVPLLGSIPYLWWEQTSREGDKFLPLTDFLKIMSLYYDNHKPVYTFGIPGIGSGIKQLYVMCTDPREFENVVHNEGRNPFGAIMSQWPFVFTVNKQNFVNKGFWTQGEEWRRLRIPTQKALLSPDAVKGYVPGLSKAAALASESFDQYEGSVDTFTVRCSFDMFSAVAFGKLTNSAAGVSDDATKQYCENVIEMLSDLVPLMLSPFQRFMAFSGFPISRTKRFVELNTSINMHNHGIIDEFMARRERGELDEYESGSYIALNLNRQEKIDNSLTLEEFKEMTSILLTASVDTTATIINWVLVFLALYPEVQSKARQELLQHVSVQGSSQDLVDTLTRSRKHLPYLQMVIREVHRMRPALASSIMKTVDKEVLLGGYAIPAGTLCQFDGYSIQNDPELIEENLKFIPERWSNESVEARKNTPSEVLDHPLLRAPFSHGARMCPGHRVAVLEVITMISSLLRRWEFAVAPGQGIKDYRDVKYFIGTTLQPKPMPKFVVKKYIG